MEKLTHEDIDFSEIYHQLDYLRSNLQNQRILVHKGIRWARILTKILTEMELLVYPSDMRNIYLKKK